MCAMTVRSTRTVWRQLSSTSQRRLRRLPFLSLALLFLLLESVAVVPVQAYIYTTTLSPSQYPATYAAAHPMVVPLGGLYEACVSTTDPKASSVGRSVFEMNNNSLSDLLSAAVPAGQVYLGGYFIQINSYSGWCWNGRNATVCPGIFCTGATCEVVENVTFSMNWAPGYPTTEGDTVVNKYIAYDASLKGWINVDGTQPLSGVACSSKDQVVELPKKKGFPWWGILIIVLGCVAIVVVVVVVVVCCCCKKNKKRNFDDADDESSFGNRSNSFSSRGTSHTGSSKGSTYTGTTGSGSYSNSSSSSTGSSSFTGTTSSGSFSTRSSSTGGSSITGSSSRGSSSTVSSSRGSSITGSSSRASSSRSSIS